MPALDLVVFDIASTIIADTGQVINAFTAAFRKHAIRVTDAEIRTLHGASTIRSSTRHPCHDR